MQLWYLFKYEDLNEVERQNNKLFIRLLNKLRVDSTDENVNKLLKSKFLHEYDEIYIKNMPFPCTWRMN